MTPELEALLQAWVNSYIQVHTISKYIYEPSKPEDREQKSRGVLADYLTDNPESIKQLAPAILYNLNQIIYVFLRENLRFDTRKRTTYHGTREIVVGHEITVRLCGWEVSQFVIDA